MAVIGGEVAAGCSEREEPQQLPEEPTVEITFEARTEPMMYADGSSIPVKWKEYATCQAESRDCFGMEAFFFDKWNGNRKSLVQKHRTRERISGRRREFVCVSGASNAGYKGDYMWFEAYDTGRVIESGAPVSPNPVVACPNGESETLQFNNFCGLLELRVSRKGFVRWIKITSRKPLAGKAKIVFEGGEPK